MTNFADWAIQKHKDANHHYDGDVPYRIHLDLTYKTALVYERLFPKHNNESVNTMKCACYGHDLMEDTRTSYNDIYSQLMSSGLDSLDARKTAEIIRAVTNDMRGRNRKERLSDQVYTDIKETTGALFVKLCDRAANLQYSKMFGTRMFEVYKSEHQHFKTRLYDETYKPMFELIDTLILVP